MPALVDGAWLNQYVAPQLLEEFVNYKDDFIGLLGKPPKGAIAADGLRMNKLINNVEFKINNSQPFTPKKMDLKKGIIEWEKIDTTPTKVDDAEVRNLAFDKRAAVRVKHSEAWKLGMRNYVMQKLAPQADATGLPVLRTSGANDGTRKRLTYADLIKFWSVIEGLNLSDTKKFNFVLCKEHKQDLILDRSATSNYRDIVIDKDTGELKKFFTLNLLENNYNPTYAAAGTLKAIGAVSAATDKNASIFFYAENTVHHVNSVKILYKPETIDTRNADPESEFRLQSYGLTNKTQEYGFGAIVSGNTTP